MRTPRAFGPGDRLQILVKKCLTALQKRSLDVEKQEVKYGADSTWQECYTDLKKECRRQGGTIGLWSTKALCRTR
jgi:hypothetical protein